MEEDPFAVLSDDLLLFIFNKLDTVHLCYIALVCRRWRYVVGQQVRKVHVLVLGKSLKQYFHIPNGRQILSIVRFFSELEVLSFRNWPWMERFSEVASVVMRELRSTTLKKLDVGGLPVQPIDVWALGYNCPNLYSLKLGGCSTVDDEFVKQCVRRLRPHLKELDISDSTRITTAAVKFAFENGVVRLKASRCKRISGALVINHVPKGNESRDDEHCLTLTQCKNINWFHLDRNLRFATINLSQCTSLEYCHVYDDALQNLHLSGCRNLRVVEVASSSLKVVNLFSCTQLSEEIVYKLIKSCPALTEINLAGLYFASHVQQWLLENRLMNSLKLG
ncbi:hypothetical protein GpartN1_g3511.t1 [Galdieria partita]|uniref:F-box domain-containing protein n=1 Tax=Galdieria partita TaxID=83374 RepID=A0A9C7PW40_9RHOD|nr:hypothetical protein GpartN1_g3511.t1 [Galdieria partita]